MGSNFTNWKYIFGVACVASILLLWLVHTKGSHTLVTEIYRLSKINTDENLEQPSTKSPRGKMKSIEKNYGLKSVQEAEEYYYQVITKNTVGCPEFQRIGRSGDGGWDVCLMGNFDLARNNCLSYSFGINNVWEFDDETSMKYGCTVRTFDPSMTKEPDTVRRPSNVMFYKIGLGKSDTTWSNGWKIMKMASFLKMFKEENKIIDILKIDIEFSEWDSFESMIEDGLLTNVKQLMFETHTEEVQGRATSYNGYIRFLNIWNVIYELGFRQWKNSWNHFGHYNSRNTGKSRTCCFEHYLINRNYI